MTARLDRLARDCAPDLLSYLVRRVAEPEDAADMLGEVFLALAARPDRIPEDETQARMWAFGVARRVLLAQRRRAASAAIEASALRQLLIEQEHVPDRDDDGDLVRAEVNRLPARQREIVILVHWDGFTLTDAAGHLGIRPTTARTLYQRARDTLRPRLARLRDGSGAVDSVEPREAGAADPLGRLDLEPRKARISKR
ncbi:MAG: sigma-70 family RNA polymerase sigma factor [Microbacterium sp.]